MRHLVAPGRHQLARRPEPELVEEAVHPARHEVVLEGAGDVSDPDARGPRKVLLEAETFDASAGYEPSVATRAFWQAAAFVQVDCIDPPPRWQPGNPSAILVAALDRTR